MTKGRSVLRRMTRITSRSASGLESVPPNPPSAPAFETAAASSAVDAPAMGAWTMGWAMPSRSVRVRVDHDMVGSVHSGCPGEQRQLSDDFGPRHHAMGFAGLFQRQGL